MRFESIDLEGDGADLAARPSSGTRGPGPAGAAASAPVRADCRGPTFAFASPLSAGHGKRHIRFLGANRIPVSTERRAQAMGSVKSQIRKYMPEFLEIHAQALNHYMFGEAELRLVRRMADPRRPALDIGANIGTYTYFLERHAAKVSAYEPNPGLAMRLRRIFPDVDVRARAVSDKPGRLELRIPVEHGRAQHELGSIVQGFDDSADVIRHEVDVVTVDGESFEDVGFIKIDVEQNEIAVLTGARATIERCRPIMMSEVSPLLYGRPIPEVFSFVTDLGYVGWFGYGGGHLPFAEFDPDRHANPERFGTPDFMGGNVFFVPAEIDGKALFRR